MVSPRAGPAGGALTAGGRPGSGQPRSGCHRPRAGSACGGRAPGQVCGPLVRVTRPPGSVGLADGAGLAGGLGAARGGMPGADG